MLHAGGHSIDSPEPIFGLVVAGLVDPSLVRRNSGAQTGDVLILTKPLGVGVMTTALKKGLLSEAGYSEVRCGTVCGVLDHDVIRVTHSITYNACRGYFAGRHTTSVGLSKVLVT